MDKGLGIDKGFFILVHNAVVTAFTKKKILNNA